jgi:hypothetical protein
MQRSSRRCGTGFKNELLRETSWKTLKSERVDVESDAEYADTRSISLTFVPSLRFVAKAVFFLGEYI